MCQALCPVTTCVGVYLLANTSIITKYSYPRRRFRTSQRLSRWSAALVLYENISPSTHVITIIIIIIIIIAQFTIYTSPPTIKSSDNNTNIIFTAQSNPQPAVILANGGPVAEAQTDTFHGAWYDKKLRYGAFIIYYPRLNQLDISLFRSGQMDFLPLQLSQIYANLPRPG